MDMSKLTQKSQEALQQAQSEAVRRGHTETDGEHLLLALVDQPARTLRGCAPPSTPTWRAVLGSAVPVPPRVRCS